MVKNSRRGASEAGVGGGSTDSGTGAAHKMQLRRRSALGDISSAVSNGASAQTQGQGAGAGAGARKSVRVTRLTRLSLRRWVHLYPELHWSSLVSAATLTHVITGFAIDRLYCSKTPLSFLSIFKLLCPKPQNLHPNISRSFDLLINFSKRPAQTKSRRWLFRLQESSH